MKLLDLFCGGGGAGAGYAAAGFEVVGWDITAHPRYPFEFHQGDALALTPEYLDQFDLIHASPPCKTHTRLKAFSSSHHLDLIPQTRALIGDRPYVIENVEGAPLNAPVKLCGSMFGLDVQRHRLFETNWPLVQPECRHERWTNRYPVKRYHSGVGVITYSPVVCVFGGGQGLGPGETDLWRKVMEMPWASKAELSQAIPPAYTKWIGEQWISLTSH